MYILIENQTKTTRSITTNNGVRHIAEQPVLMFKEGETYPDKCTLTLAFTPDEQKAINAQALQQGEYDVKDSCFFVNNFGGVAFNLRPEGLTPKSKSLQKAS